MNKYVIRTSLVWIVLAGGAAGFYWYVTRTQNHPVAGYAGVQPLAIGSGAGTPPETQLAPVQLTPVQLTPERMQSIGVKTGTVEWRYKLAITSVQPAQWI